MGCAGSSIEALPVTVHQSGLSVIDEISIKTSIETMGLDLSFEGIILSIVNKIFFLKGLGNF